MRQRAALIALHCCLLAAGTAGASTIADYSFNGPINYTAPTSSTAGMLSVATGPSGAQIFQSTGLPAPFALIPTGQAGANQLGSEVVLSVSLIPGSLVDNGHTTTASFAEPAGDQAALYLGNGAGQPAALPVLTGTLSDMQVSGFDGNNAGVLTGFLHPNGGSAFSFFSDPSDVIALDFNLSTNFGQAMYQSSFSGQINGQVEALPMVPISSTLPLLLSGLGVTLALSRRRAAIAPSLSGCTLPALLS